MSATTSHAPNPKFTALVMLARKATKDRPMAFAVVVKGGTDGALMLNRRKVPPPEIAAAKKQVASTTVFTGRCFMEEGKLVFESARQPPAPLGRLLKTLLARDAGVTLTVLARHAPDLVEEPDAAETPGPAPATAAPPPPPPPPPAGLAVRAELIQHYQSLLPEHHKALERDPEHRPLLERLAAQAKESLKQEEAPPARTALEHWEEAIKAALSLAGTDGPSADAAANGKAAPAPRKGTQVMFTQARLVWDAARKKVQSELRALEGEILHVCQAVNDDPDAEYEFDSAEVAAGVKSLYKILEGLDERLIDKLDEALSAADPEVREQKHQEAAKIVKEYQAFVESDPLMQDIDENGFAPTHIRSTVLAALGGLASKL